MQAHSSLADHLIIRHISYANTSAKHERQYPPDLCVTTLDMFSRRGMTSLDNAEMTFIITPDNPHLHVSAWVACVHCDACIVKPAYGDFCDMVIRRLRIEHALRKTFPIHM